MTEPINARLEISTLGDQPLEDFLASFLGEARARETLRLGAVYCNRQRCEPTDILLPRAHLRIHLEPRRFPVDSINWNKQILEETEEYLIVNKPPGIPVHPTCDNQEENLIRQLERHLNRPLWIIHRLDVNTSGLMVLAKTKAACTRIAALLARPDAIKEYQCWISGPVPLGIHTHFRPRESRVPFPMTEFETPHSKKCVMEIVTCEEKELRNQIIWEARVRLITGRHHQIRSQLAALKRPILGDFVYGAEIAWISHPGIGLHCCQLHIGEGSYSISHYLPYTVSV